MVDLGVSPVDRRGLEPAVSWGAVFAGAFTTVAVGLVLAILAAGFGYKIAAGGLASRDSLAGFSPLAGCCMIVAQVLAAGLGGYLAGRLRTVWWGVHSDESHFRDTAHGLIVWAVATVAGVVLAATVLGPYADSLAGPAAAAAADPVRAANIAAQSSFFVAVGLLLSAFIAAVAARLGGMQAEHMHGQA